MIIKYLLTYLLILFTAGCSLFPHYDQLMVLKRFGSSQAEAKEDVKKQEENFCKLRGDIENNRLKKNTSKKHILIKYGNPVFCKSDLLKGQLKQLCVYRLPSNELNTVLIYLYFGEKEKLDSWEFVHKS
ncbi:MAG: hypothetical protein ABSE81_02905 [Candidatus Omnitrophota bacterium]